MMRNTTVNPFAYVSTFKFWLKSATFDACIKMYFLVLIRSFKIKKFIALCQKPKILIEPISNNWDKIEDFELKNRK
ncbi:hypothetical protein BpHYR1_017712 [Brachionus plicatilis]|uniref:Uncharacterized protein n=1 Tax=Brachionus plicatilis TaxID=10195 RepID=A0A3M7PQN7_BRAPC|nr:hypothetical protein BpHYR1_017712 [Brachionus plicatilis]